MRLFTLGDTQTIGRTPLDKELTRSKDLSLTTRNIQKRVTSIPSEGFEPTIPAIERPQTHHALDRVATGIGTVAFMGVNLVLCPKRSLRVLEFRCTGVYFFGLSNSEQGSILNGHIVEQK